MAGSRVDADRQRGEVTGRRPASPWALRPCPARFRTDHELPPWSVGFDPTPAAPGLARKALAPLGEHLTWEGMENLRLLATELVTNSVMHGAGGPGSIRMHAHLFPECTVVLISDGGPGFEPDQLRGSRPGRPGGRGLELVVLLADALGIDGRDPFGVWFSLGRGVDPQA